jgi:hypothetical protein
MLSTAIIFALGVGAGVSVTGFGNAMQQHVKVAPLYKADLVTAMAKKRACCLPNSRPAQTLGRHYHPGDAFAYILEG